jgi:hypothetical protein
MENNAWKRSSLPVRITVLIIIVMTTLRVGASEPIRIVYSHPWSTFDLYTILDQSGPATEEPTVFHHAPFATEWEPLTAIQSANMEWTTVTSIHVDPHFDNGDIIFSGTSAAGIYRSVDGGLTWSAWNDAAIGIIGFAGSSLQERAVWAITTDGAAFVTSDRGENWTLDSAMSRHTATSIGYGGNDTVYIGTSTGVLAALRDGGTAGYFLRTISASNGELTGIPGTVTHVSKNDHDVAMLIVDKIDGSGNALYREESPSGMHLEEVQTNGQIDSVQALLATADQVFIVNGGANPTLLVSENRGDSWQARTLPVTEGIADLSAGNCSGLDCQLYLATDAGGFRSDDSGVTWSALGNILPTPAPPPVGASDPTVTMASPLGQELVTGLNTFKVRLANLGPGTARGFAVDVELVVWGEYATGDYRHADSATIGLNNCREVSDNQYGYLRHYHKCWVDEIAAGESIIITLQQNLTASQWTAEVSARINFSFESVGELNQKNNNTSQSFYRADTFYVSPDERGGGSIGLLPLLLLMSLLIARKHRCAK